ncbi:DUF2441 domain-containing protein [Fangia hongkongensis]|uniref:DUF2441 domain-containing protein n=2 Tax=Fangia hongkongensis TaxID=270495 RepID=UPI00037F822C|nr:DUF2441 domain-containing protein [Fangia hongkongensis]
MSTGGHQLYWTTNINIETGAIIEPGGHKAKYINSFVMNDNVYFMYYETILELVRQRNFPDKPSRYDSLFVCKSLDDIHHFMKQYNRIGHFIYNIKPKSQEFKIHHGNFKSVSPHRSSKFCNKNAIGCYTHQDYLDNAFDYWSGDNIEDNCMEVCIASSIILLEKIS